MKKLLFTLTLAFVGFLANAQTSSFAMEGGITTNHEYLAGVEYQHSIGESPFSYAFRAASFDAKRYNAETGYDRTTHVTAGPRGYLTIESLNGKFFFSPGVGADYHYAALPYNKQISTVDPAATVKAGLHYGHNGDGLLYLFGNGDFSNSFHIYTIGVGVGGFFHPRARTICDYVN